VIFGMFIVDKKNEYISGGGGKTLFPICEHKE